MRAPSLLSEQNSLLNNLFIIDVRVHTLLLRVRSHFFRHNKIHQIHSIHQLMTSGNRLIESKDIAWFEYLPRKTTFFTNLHDPVHSTTLCLRFSSFSSRESLEIQKEFKYKNEVEERSHWRLLSAEFKMPLMRISQHEKREEGEKRNEGERESSRTYLNDRAALVTKYTKKDYSDYKLRQTLCTAESFYHDDFYWNILLLLSVLLFQYFVF